MLEHSSAGDPLTLVVASESHPPGVPTPDGDAQPDQNRENPPTVAVKIRLKRMGKIRAPYYRIVVADSRTKRDGRAIEEIGKYHPTSEPSLMEVDSERVQYWLGVGAQPTEQVLAIFKVTGDWQKFKGLPGAEGTYRAPQARTKPVVPGAAAPAAETPAAAAPAAEAPADAAPSES